MDKGNTIKVKSKLSIKDYKDIIEKIKKEPKKELHPVTQNLMQSLYEGMG